MARVDLVFWHGQMGEKCIGSFSQELRIPKKRRPLGEGKEKCSLMGEKKNIA